MFRELDTVVCYLAANLAILMEPIESVAGITRWKQGSVMEANF